MGVPLDVNSIQPCDVLFFTHEHFTDVLKKSLSVTRHNVDIDRVNGLSLIAPADFDQAFLIVSNKVLDIGTVDAMNRDTTTASDKSDDIVGKRRMAAQCQLRHHTVDANDKHIGVVTLLCLRASDEHLGLRLGLFNLGLNGLLECF